MYQIKVRHKGQVTLPAELRRRLKIDEGSLLEVELRPEGILLKPLPPIEGGRVVGEEVYREVIEYLEKLRRKWRRLL